MRLGPGPMKGPSMGRTLSGKRVLELGCGHGLPGIVALINGAEVHFQVSIPPWNPSVKVMSLRPLSTHWSSDIHSGPAPCSPLPPTPPPPPPFSFSTCILCLLEPGLPPVQHACVEA